MSILRIFDLLKIVKLFAKLHWRSCQYARSLSFRQDNLSSIISRDIILFSTMKNETHRLPFFLDYYRKLGVAHFVFVDNDSSDGFDEFVRYQNDITTFHTTGSYKKSNFGMHWLNYLLRKYGTGHWCMVCDPDEFLVFPEMESRDLRDLTEYLESTKEESFFSCMIDMYGKGSIDDSYYRPGDDPLSACPYFDGTGYVKTRSEKFRNVWLQGGVRRRVFSQTNPESAPALNKVPLIKWKRHFAYVESMHMAVPRRLNQACAPTKTTGALLHFKFLAQLRDKVAAEMEAKQHYNDSAEYRQYAQAMKNNSVLYDPTVSVAYEDWRTFAKLGLISKGEW